MQKIKIAIAGVGNCASSLVQGIEYYRDKSPESAIGLMHWQIGDWRPQDIEVVTAFDVDVRKVGKDVAEAIFQPPNCATVFCSDVPKAGVQVRMGPILDGIAEHMRDHPEARTFLPSDEREPTREEVTLALHQSGADVLLNYLPVGSEAAARFYAECALEAGVALVNCIPVFIASDPDFAARLSSSSGPISSTPAATPTSSTCSTEAASPPRRSRRPKPCSRFLPSASRTTTSTSVRATT